MRFVRRFGGWSLAVVPAVLLVVLASPPSGSVQTDRYVGDEACLACHGPVDRAGVHYDVPAEVAKSSHPYALMTPPPAYPEGTNEAGVPAPPGLDWSEIAYVVGGYGWKALYVTHDGRLHSTDSSRYNLATGSWSAHEFEPGRRFDESCFRCHTTGPTRLGSWNGNPADSLGTFFRAGVGCEACHGPMSRHVEDPLVEPPVDEIAVAFEQCGTCHNEGGKDAPIAAVDGFLHNHTQYNEMAASRHGEVGYISCATCHSAHEPLLYPDLTGRDFDGAPLGPIRRTCEQCHATVAAPDHPATATCVDCHMPAAARSAVGETWANDGARGDVAAHIWRIRTTPEPRAAMFTSDGTAVRPDSDGKLSLTLGFACLGCHTEVDETLDWAAAHAAGMHRTATATATDAPGAEPGRLLPGYPNPFRATTRLGFQLDRPARVRLEIYTADGRLVAVPVDEHRSPGIHQVDWDGRGSAAGAYLVRLDVAGAVETRLIHRLP